MTLEGMTGVATGQVSASLGRISALINRYQCHVNGIEVDDQGAVGLGQGYR